MPSGVVHSGSAPIRNSEPDSQNNGTVVVKFHQGPVNPLLRVGGVVIRPSQQGHRTATTSRPPESPIPGLYAVGNDQASALGGRFPTRYRRREVDLSACIAA